jgi:hypothetical protein
MPVERETETVQRQIQTVWYGCDADGCEERSQWREDLNFVVTNPSMRQMVPSNKSNVDALDWDEVLILCDEHLSAYDSAMEDVLGVEPQQHRGLTLDPR